MPTRSTYAQSNAERLAEFRHKYALIHGPQFNTAFPAGQHPRPAQPAPAG